MEFVDLKAQYARLKSSIDGRIATVFEHQRFIQGPEVSAFEDALSNFLGAAHTVGVASGTDALLVALMAEDIGPGDAVFLPAFTFTATAEVVLTCGATPIFCDVDGRDFNIDCVSLEDLIKETESKGDLRPKAVISVDLFGQAADYRRLKNLSERYNLFLLADAAQSIGGRVGNEWIGTLAHATSASFFPAKPLGCYGDGGALITDDLERAAIYRSIGAHGKGQAKYDIVRPGLNSRLDTIQAAVLLSKLEVFEDELKARNRVAASYTERLSANVLTPLIQTDRTSAWAQYAILLENRDEVAAHLKSKGIPTAVYYPQPMHLQTAYREFGDGEGSLPVSESLCEQILCLPMHPYLEEAEVERISNAVMEISSGKGGVG